MRENNCAPENRASCSSSKSFSPDSKSSEVQLDAAEKPMHPQESRLRKLHQAARMSLKRKQLYFRASNSPSDSKSLTGAERSTSSRFVDLSRCTNRGFTQIRPSTLRRFSLQAQTPMSSVWKALQDIPFQCFPTASLAQALETRIEILYVDGQVLPQPEHHVSTCESET